VSCQTEILKKADAFTSLSWLFLGSAAAWGGWWHLKEKSGSFIGCLIKVNK